MSYIVVFRIKISIRITKKKYVSVFEKNIFTLKYCGFYVNLVRHFVAYSQPFNPPINKGAMVLSFFFGDALYRVRLLKLYMRISFLIIN
jgi:hypothetical protein